MARIKATEEFRLSRRYGAIWWNYETGYVYGIPERYPEDTHRPYFRIDDGTETQVALLDFEYFELGEDTPVRSGIFWSGQIGLIVDQRVRDTYQKPNGAFRFWKTVQNIDWWWSNGTADAPNHFWDGIGCFALRHESGHRTFFFQGPANGNIVRWNTGECGDGIDPGKIGQYLPWRLEGGEIRGMDFCDCSLTTESIQTPSKYLILACDTGRIAWMDVSDWDADNQVMTHYKSLGLADARDISDIAYDRQNNVLWVLDSGSRLLKYELDPYGETELTAFQSIYGSDHINTPHICKLDITDKTFGIGDTPVLTAQFLDMWDQVIESAGLQADIICAGANCRIGGSIRATSETDATGTLSVTLTGYSSGKDEIIVRYIDG